MFDLNGDEARLLLNVALMATGQNRFQSAAKILAVLERFRPKEESVAVAKTVLMISMQDFALAVDFVDGVGLQKFPDSSMLRAFRGMALVRMGRKEDAEECLLAVARSTDEAAANLAKGLLTS